MTSNYPGNKSAKEYVTKFDEFLTHYNIRGMYFFNLEMNLKKTWYMSFGIMKSLILSKFMPWSKIYMLPS